MHIGFAGKSAVSRAAPWARIWVNGRVINIVAGLILQVAAPIRNSTCITITCHDLKFIMTNIFFQFALYEIHTDLL